MMTSHPPEPDLRVNDDYNSQEETFYFVIVHPKRFAIIKDESAMYVVIYSRVLAAYLSPS